MLNVTIAQLNFTVGDIQGNLKKILKAIDENHRESHLIVFPELSLSGYPPEDLLLQRHFLDEVHKALKELIRKTKNYNCLIVVGTPYYDFDLYNAMALIYKGKLLGIYKKHFLPNYSVFDEERYFRKGEELLLGSLNDFKLSFSICEDIWYPDGVERKTALSGAEVIININASPYHIGKYKYKEAFLKARAEDNNAFVVYVNLVGGQDELIFDGRSLVIDPTGEIIARGKAFDEDVFTTSLEVEKVRKKRLIDLRWRKASEKIERVPEKFKLSINKKSKYKVAKIRDKLSGEREIYTALTLALKDYTEKNGFPKVVLGLSGGIDSSLVACIAVDALGKDRVVGVYMPSEFSSQESYEDANKLARNLGIEFHVISITDIFKSYREEFEKEFCELSFDVADENIQARIRANILFYFSNKFGYMVLSTSNKSESAVGYTTIYGDMSGGFAPIKDVYKTLVYKLAKYRNSLSKVIPERVFRKPPSAELRPNQTDQDTLPPYEELDEILRLYIEDGLSPEEIVERGFPKGDVFKVVAMIRKSEYKRRQAPVGPKITERAFGKDWRMPITNRFKF